MKEKYAFNWYHLIFKVASAADTVKVTCVRSGWGAYVNLTSLKYLHPDAVQPEKIVINLPNCYGFVYADQVIFTQNYTTCSSNRTVSLLENCKFNILTDNIWSQVQMSAQHKI